MRELMAISVTVEEMYSARDFDGTEIPWMAPCGSDTAKGTYHLRRDGE